MQQASAGWFGAHALWLRRRQGIARGIMPAPDDWFFENGSYLPRFRQRSLRGLKPGLERQHRRPEVGGTWIEIK